ncbi:hypothetical protein LXL04_020077 [Taraxacum kok-saghyz]
MTIENRIFGAKRRKYMDILIATWSGEKATAGAIADAIAENRAELVHLPATMDLNGVMKCPECKDKLQVRISADDIIEPPWKAYNIMKKMDYPYEHIIDSMKDPSIAAFWLITMPQIMELNVPLNASSWSEEDLKDPKKLYEMTVLLNAQREIADKILDDQWETNWRQEKIILIKMLEEKLQPYIENIDNGVLPQPILIATSKTDQNVEAAQVC